MTTDERLDRLTRIVDSLAASVVHHDDQIENLIAIADKHQDRLDKLTLDIAELRQSTAQLQQSTAELRQSTAELRESTSDLRRAMAETNRLWEAYLRRLPPQ